MAVFDWSSRFETGIEPADEHHKKLVVMLNDLGDLMLAPQQNREDLQCLFSALFDYARQHFDDEEQLMADYGLDSRHTDAHRKEHAEFVHELELMTQTHSADPHSDFEVLYRYLVSWFSFHILGTDHAMARQILRIRSGISAEAALEQELSSSGQGRPALQDALFDLYEAVTAQNRQLHARNKVLENQVSVHCQALETANNKLFEEQQILQAINQQLEQVQTQILKSEKMASIGQLAASVAHEINNPIGFVNSNLGTLKIYLERLFDVLGAYACIEKLIPPGTELAALQSAKQTAELNFLQRDVVDLLTESREGLERVKTIVQDLKDFSRTAEAEWRETDLNHDLDCTLNVIWNEIKFKANIVKDYGDIPRINCIASQISQVFMNLIINASHAIEEFGTITLRTQRQNNLVMVEVADTGKGMPLEVQSRIFEPFFTTKPAGKGTGLGLSLSYDIIQKHGGHIEVSSAPGEGTSFKVWLPLERKSEPK